MSSVTFTTSPTNSTTIALIDHRDLTRIALIRSFSHVLSGTLVIGVASLEDLAGHATADLRLVILHPDHHPFSAQRIKESISSARALLGEVAIVILTEGNDDATISDIMQGGASAYLTTSMPLDLAAATLRLVIAGGTSFPSRQLSAPSSARPVPAAPAPETQAQHAQHALQSTFGRLTRREEEVLRFVGQGAQNKTIAFMLKMSENTVKVHLHRILQKFHLHNRTEVALLASRYFAAVHAARINPGQMIAEPDQDMTGGFPPHYLPLGRSPTADLYPGRDL
jgi:DNA-binding NarL/FixJ family response regulator